MSIETTVPFNQEDLTDVLLRKVIPELKQMLECLTEALPCRQYQWALDDIESSEYHLRNLIAVGPLPPLVDVPLEDSEVQDAFDFGDFDGSREIVYADGPTQGNENE